MSTVTVYSTRNCPYCRMAKVFLDKQGVRYTNIDVGVDAVAAEKMIALSGQRGVPVITVDDEVIVGFDSQRLNELFGTHVSSETYDVVIVGAGPAGLTAGVYCARKLLKTLVVSESIGGQALESWAIENYMGYRMITGEDLMKKFEEQVRTLDVRLELDRVSSITPEENLFRRHDRVRDYPKGKEPDPDPGKTAPETRGTGRGEVSRARPLHLLDLRWSALQGKEGRGGRRRQLGTPDRSRDERDRLIGEPDRPQHDQGGSGVPQKTRGNKEYHRPPPRADHRACRRPVPPATSR